jgi:hypothetical protein
MALTAIVSIIAAEFLLFLPARKVAFNESTFTGVIEVYIDAICPGFNVLPHLRQYFLAALLYRM